LARIGRAVYGAPDPKAGAVGSLWDVVRDRRLNHRPEVVSGVLEVECAALLRRFFEDRRVPHKPYLAD
jgi:tRNA(adenine34) deaminase